MEKKLMMTPRDVAELTGIYKKKDDVAIQCMAGCTIDLDREIQYVEKPGLFLTHSKDERYMYTKWIESVLKCKTIYDKLISAPVADNALLLDLINSEMKDEEKLNELYERINEYYNTAGHFVIKAFYNVYDIPHAKGDTVLDSEEVYKHIIILICPLIMEKPGLIYDGTGFVVKPRRWEVSPPETAIIYPAFENRKPEWNKLIWYSADPSDPQHVLVDEGFTMEHTKTATEYREDVEGAIFRQEGSPVTSHTMMRELSDHLGKHCKAENNVTREVEPEVIKNILSQLYPLHNFEMVLDELKKKWKKKPMEGQLVSEKLMKEQKKVDFKRKYRRLLRSSSDIAYHAGNMDLRSEIEDFLGTEDDE